MAGGLNFGGDNSQLFTHQGIEEGAFTGIGPAKNAYKSRFKHDLLKKWRMP
jgi:hypothetical protein